MRCHNPWPSEDVRFCPDGALPAFVTGIPALSSGPELWYAVHNHRLEPLQLHAGQSIVVLEVVHLTEAPATASPSSQHPTKPCQPPLPECLSPLQQQQLNELFKEFQDVFSQGDDDLGNTPLLEHGIETHGPPLRQPYRRQNPAVCREEMTQVQQMLSSNVIRPSNSPWASPVAMVRKKDGSLRFCVDFRQLNAATIKDAHPLPRIDDLLDALHGAKWFSTLDLKSGYWQVPISEQDKEKTAFRTSSGQLFEFNQVPFGLCNAPATFSRLMDRVLAGLHWETCLFYLDDIIVFSSTWEEHLARLREVFKRLRHAKLKLGAAKCTFAAKEVSYLGHRVTEEGLLPDPLLLAAIRDIPPPKTATEVHSFLGLAGYYRRYVKGFATIAAPLHALTRKDAVFHWSEDCQNSFDQLKARLTTSSITAFPDFSQEFRLYTDASTAGLGAILAQVREGKECIICCASSALNKAEKSYPAWRLCGQSPSSVLTSWPCHSRYSRTIMRSNGLRRCARGLRSSTAGLQRSRSMTLPCAIVRVKFRPMWTDSVAFQLVLCHQKTPYCIFRWIQRKKLPVWHRSCTQPHISEVKLCGSYLATAISTKLAAESA